MSAPEWIPWAAAAAGAALAVDAFARLVGCYETSARWWPATWRRRRGARGEGTPYRHALGDDWEPRVRAGIPRSVSMFVAPCMLLSAFWSLAIVLALSDVPAALSGTRRLRTVLASLALCVASALVGWITLNATLERRDRAFAVAITLALALNSALAVFPLPCSDVRADDVRFALAGLITHAPLALAYAWHRWRRRGSVSFALDQTPVLH
ncbi:MAG: hypothetical protein R3A48_27375 [Polyangiales bacterium]